MPGVRVQLQECTYPSWLVTASEDVIHAREAPNADLPLNSIDKHHAASFIYFCVVPVYEQDGRFRNLVPKARTTYSSQGLHLAARQH